MAQTQFDSTDYEELIFLELKKIAFKNGIKGDKKSLISMSLKIAESAIKYMDEESFLAITNLKK